MVDETVKNFFKRIDECTTVEEINAIRARLSDEHYQRIFWRAREKALTSADQLEKRKALAKCEYINQLYAARVPVSKAVNRFTTPHGFKGIAISRFAKVGTGCTIFQNVTIGSNTLPDSKNAGFPTVGNNVYIGAGAMIVGNVTVGNNVRIGAGCTVTTDIPDNATVAQPRPTIIRKSAPPDNTFLTPAEFRKLHVAAPVRPTAFKRADGRVVDAWKRRDFDEAFRILFCGDLILLEDQVKRAFDGQTYDFNPLFEYTRRYIKAADYSIGVFEGTCGGTRRPYSQSNYADAVYLYINFPDTFADAVKGAGFDLVTNANNHILDMQVDGVRRTIDVLDQKQLDHFGSYKTLEQKQSERVKIVERDGIKMAILAYTYGINHRKTDELISGELDFVTSYLVDDKSPKYTEVLESVRRDFEIAKSHQPDLIIVLPHWGTQFVDEPNDYQKLWRKNFLDFGADIIFGDHTHSVQPVKLETVDGRMTYTLFSPGNYANIYRGHNGDATAMVEVYIDRKTKKVIGGAVIPMWVQSTLRGNYRALPIFEILNNPKLGNEISTYELERAEFIHKHITRVMLGVELDLNMAQERLYLDEHGFMRSETPPLDITDEMMSRPFHRLLTSAENICFVGDSITAGSRNGGVPWYEPIERLIRGNVFNRAWDSCTLKRLLKNHLEEITSAEADLFVIAIGTNDVRYRNAEICSMDATEYVERLTELRKAIVEKHPEAKLVFITPWYSLAGDRVSKINHTGRKKLIAEYSTALKSMCEATGDTFLDPKAYILRRLLIEPRSKYLRDSIHPNATEGVRLYAAAVMLS